MKAITWKILVKNRVFVKVFLNFSILVFIYSMPGYNCPIKERMLYSSSKNMFTKLIAKLGIEIVKNVTFLPEIFRKLFYFYRFLA